MTWQRFLWIAAFEAVVLNQGLCSRLWVHQCNYRVVASCEP